MKIIGITGGIASGKTTVSNILRGKGAVIIDADIIAHQILEKGKEGWEEVKDFFGKEILQENGAIDRSYLGKIVFDNKEKLKKLEEITHPLIMQEIDNRLEKARLNNIDKKPVFLDAALLFETGLDRLVDEVWVVYVDETTQLERLMNRDNLPQAEAEKRIEAQLSLKKKKELADLVIDNSGDFNQLKRKINVLWEKF